MRLDKYISHATELSRSEGRKFLKAGAVSVNGQAITDPAHAIQPADTITLDGEPLALPSHRYLMLHKPRGYVSATTDSDHPTVLDLLAPQHSVGMKVAGRLDLDTTGLVLLSDDGAWLHRVTSPRQGCDKVYRVTLRDPVDDDAAIEFQKGLWLHGEDKKTLPAGLRILAPKEVEVTLSEGRYHQVKRMFAAIGNGVKTLHRIRIGNIDLDTALEPGQYRALTDKEVDSV